jgi:hypothetical protein
MPVLLLLASCLLLAPQRLEIETPISIGVWYAGPRAQPPSTAAGDLEIVQLDLAAIRRVGFNSITTWVEWRQSEPKRGAYALAAAERLIAAAGQADLRVDVQVFADAAPAWSSAVAADRQRFLDYASRRLRLSANVMSVAPAESANETPRSIRVGKGARTAVDARLEFWAAIAQGVRRVMFVDTEGGGGPASLSLGETAGIVTRNQALFAPLRPREGGVRGVAGASGAPVDVKLLESPDALMIIALNYAPAPQKVTIDFTADIPEAIWQNLETGASVNFVIGRNGPFLEHVFAPRDTLVLMIRKTLR